MTDDGSSAGSAAPAGSGMPPGILMLPVLWVALQIGLSVYGIAGMWPSTYEFGLPNAVVYWLYFEIAVALITILWGAWLMGNAYRRSSGFPRAFTVWQCFGIVAICLSVGFTLVDDSFLFQLSGIVLPAAEVAVGVFLIVLLTRRPGAAAAFHEDGSRRPPTLVYLINAILGAIAGGVAGMILGFLAGALLADVYNVSCFEGGCGYFAAGIGLLGMAIGALIGILAAIRLTGRRSRRAAGREPAVK